MTFTCLKRHSVDDKFCSHLISFLFESVLLFFAQNSFRALHDHSQQPTSTPTLFLSPGRGQTKMLASLKDTTSAIANMKMTFMTRYFSILLKPNTLPYSQYNSTIFLSDFQTDTINKTSYIVQALKEDTSYTFQVFAYSYYGESFPSESLTVRTLQTEDARLTNFSVPANMTGEAKNEVNRCIVIEW